MTQQEFNKRSNMEALDKLEKQINKNIEKEFEKNGFCYAKDAFKDAILESYYKYNNMVGFVNIEPKES